MPDTFTCDACGNTYDKEWTDEEAYAEASDLWGEDVHNHATATVCEDCFQQFMRELSN